VPESKVKIIHFIDSLGSGGAERLLYTNIKHLDPSRFEHLVVTVFEKPDFWIGPIRSLGSRVETLGLNSRTELIKGIKSFNRMLQRERPDLIHVHLWTAGIIGRIAGRHRKIPVISSVHSLDHEPAAFRDADFSLRAKLSGTRALDRWTASLGRHRYIAVSERVKESIRKRLGIAENRIDVIYNPIDLGSANFSVPGGTLRNEIGAGPNSHILLMVGRVSKEKGIIDAIKALEDIRKSGRDLHLAVIGAKSEPVFLQQVIHETVSRGLETRVHLLGERSNIFDYLSECDVFLFPSHFEGLGIALAEAMAAGCACVASDVAPIIELMTDKETGLLVQPHAPPAIATAVDLLLGDSELRRRLGENARRKAFEMFDPVKAAKKLESVYLRTVAI
jgi:glycosyltransferase involved in cell wall biosynthesis